MRYHVPTQHHAPQHSLTHTHPYVGIHARSVEDWDEEDMDRSIAPTPLPDDPADAADPLMRTSVRALLRDGLAALHADDPSFLTNAAASLGDCREIAVLRALLEASGA